MSASCLSEARVSSNYQPAWLRLCCLSGESWKGFRFEDSTEMVQFSQVRWVGCIVVLSGWGGRPGAGIKRIAEGRRNWPVMAIHQKLCTLTLNCEDPNFSGFCHRLMPTWDEACCFEDWLGSRQEDSVQSNRLPDYLDWGWLCTARLDMVCGPSFVPGSVELGHTHVYICYIVKSYTSFKNLMMTHVFFQSAEKNRFWSERL